MRRRSLAVVFGAAIVAGLALVALGVADGEHRDMNAGALLYVPWAWAMVGVWAEARGITATEIHWLYPGLSAAAVVDHLAGGAR